MSPPARLSPFLVSLTVALAAAGPALSQAACGHERAVITCPDGHVWDAAAMVCTPPATS